MNGPALTGGSSPGKSEPSSEPGGSKDQWRIPKARKPKVSQAVGLFCCVGPTSLSFNAVTPKLGTLQVMLLSGSTLVLSPSYLAWQLVSVSVCFLDARPLLSLRSVTGTAAARRATRGRETRE